MRKPNFFIIGAPKSGTTSLASWLADHPNVYIPPAKEIHYFCSDLNIPGRPKSDREYLQFFRSAPTNALAIGEASVSYLSSKHAIRNIERFCNSPRYIVMIRNPIDIAYSFHQEKLFLGEEEEPDFVKAWKLSPDRRRGIHVPKECPDGKLLDYQEIGLLGKHISRLLEAVPRDRLLILLLDDMKNNPRREYLKVLDFLNLPDEGRTHFPVLNKSKSVRWPLLRRVVKGAGQLRARLGIPPLGKGIYYKLITFNAKYSPRQPLPEDFVREMKAFYKDDVELLAQLINRDLSYWLD